jgi:cell division protein FtsQ
MAGLCAAAAFPASAIFDLRSVTVEGNSVVPASAILRQAGVGPGVGAFRVNAWAIRERLLADPRILDVRVATAFPGGLRVLIRERQPVAALALGGRYVLLSDDAVALVEAPGPGSLPVLQVDRLDPQDVAPGGVVRVPDVRLGAQIAGALPASVRDRIVAVRIDREGEAALALRDEISVRLGGPRGIMVRLEMVPQALDAVAARGMRVRSVDLRFAGNIVVQPVRLAGAPPPSPLARQENPPARGIEPAMHRPSNP